jgi:hypothetical protein
MIFQGCVVEFYHIGFNGFPDSVGSHFGSFQTTMNLLDGLFNAAEPRYFTGKTFAVCAAELTSPTPSILRQETPEAALRAFADFAAKATLYKVEATFDKILTIADCWGDDPIGSGGLDIFANTPNLTPRQQQEIKKIFAPFKGVIYPQDIDRILNPKAIRLLAKPHFWSAIL